MAYFRSDGREFYVSKTGSFPVATTYSDGVTMMDINTFIYYVVKDGNWVVDKSEYNGNVYNSSGTLVNLSDTYYDKTITVEDTNTRYFRQGFVFGAGYTWKSVTANSTINLHLFTGSKPVYLIYGVDSVGLCDYGFINNMTITSGGNGTSIPILNRNSPMGNNPTATFFRDATYTGGTITIPRFLGTGGNVIQRSGGSGVSQESIVPANSHFIFTAQNSGTATQERMSIYADWLEITT